MPTDKLKIRCPCCGRVCFPSQFQKSYPFELINARYFGGRGKKNRKLDKSYLTFSKITDPHLIKVWKDWLFQKISIVYHQFGPVDASISLIKSVNALMPSTLKVNSVMNSGLRIQLGVK